MSTFLFLSAFLAILTPLFCFDLRKPRREDGTYKTYSLRSEILPLSRQGCSPCRPGSVTYSKGTSVTCGCEPCPKGSFSSQAGATTCTPCPQGTNSLQGSTECVKCKPGTSLTAMGCEQCDRNTFSGASSLSCIPCPKGSVSEPKSSKCEKCPKGTLASAPSSGATLECIPCAEGSFGDKEGAISCTICPPGTFSESGATGCTACPAGKFAPLIASIKCDPCPAGTDSKPGSAACKDPVRGCTFDTFEDSNGRCSACLPGQRLDPMKKKCVQCGKRQVSEGGVAIECKDCPNDQVPVENIGFFDGFVCRCPVGKVDEGDGNCRVCPQDTFGRIFAEADGGLTGGPRSRFRAKRLEPFFSPLKPEPACERCSVTVDVENRNSCSRLCPAANSFFDTRTRQCSKCPEGFFLGREGPSIGATNCVSAETGCWFPLSLVAGRCRVAKCPKDTFFSSIFTCRSCRVDQFYDAARDQCGYCSKRRFSTGGTPLKCEKKCPRNSLFSLNRRECVCNEGFEFKGGKCVRCRPGTERDANAVGAGTKTCYPCRTGTARGETDRSCRSCGSNGIADESKTKCEPCPAGTKVGIDVRGNRVDKCVPIDPYPILS